VGSSTLHGITLFCQALIGLTLASGMEDFEPLPVVSAFINGDRAWLQLGLMLVISLVVVLPAMVIGTIGLDIGQQVFSETDYTHQAQGSLPPDIGTAFAMLLAGAGIAEETPFRLVCLTLTWRLTRRRKLSITLSALLFGLYHLTPLNGMYQVFLQYPISQFLASTLIGMIWGVLYVRRGYETAVLSHTLSDWLPLVIFTAV
jgi:membrane protease YdiL (CAAX protease family)